jgi:hypothetical protein
MLIDLTSPQHENIRYLGIHLRRAAPPYHDPIDMPQLDSDRHEGVLSRAHTTLVVQLKPLPHLLDLAVALLLGAKACLQLRLCQVPIMVDIERLKLSQLAVVPVVSPRHAGARARRRTPRRQTQHLESTRIDRTNVISLEKVQRWLLHNVSERGQREALYSTTVMLMSEC